MGVHMFNSWSLNKISDRRGSQVYLVKYKSLVVFYLNLTAVCFSLINSISFESFRFCCCSPPLPMTSPGGGFKAGDHHDVGLAEVDPVLEPRRHHLKGLQVLQGVHLESLPQVD